MLGAGEKEGYVAVTADEEEARGHAGVVECLEGLENGSGSNGVRMNAVEERINL